MAAPPIGEHLLKMRGTGEKALSAYRSRLQENAREKVATAAAGPPIDHQEAMVGHSETVLFEAADSRESDLLAVGRHGIHHWRPCCWEALAITSSTRLRATFSSTGRGISASSLRVPSNKWRAAQVT